MVLGWQWASIDYVDASCRLSQAKKYFSEKSPVAAFSFTRLHTLNSAILDHEWILVSWLQQQLQGQPYILPSLIIPRWEVICIYCIVFTLQTVATAKKWSIQNWNINDTQSGDYILWISFCSASGTNHLYWSYQLLMRQDPDDMHPCHQKYHL